MKPANPVHFLMEMENVQTREGYMDSLVCGLIQGIEPHL